MTETDRCLRIATSLFREVAVAKLVRDAQEGTIPCAQVPILADQHTAAFKRMLFQRMEDDLTTAAVDALSAQDGQS